jgi:methyl-accepting chemotaxis protein
VVTKLGSSSEEIGHVIKLINSIAEQTNLLALNATIEAARAGNAGKGFAVVAGEVKALASQTSNATGEISDQIVGIQSDATNAVGSMGTVSSIINQVNEHEASVAAAVEEQSAAVNEISRNAQEASQGANQTMSAAEELTTLSARIEELISTFDLQS